ncbi:MAG TPA: GNAT family N-acetyltransferase [Epsilonproteobacteria bacterium]|nr:GNAT family N-acetyltransferase [Campylobacterota bacterium]HHH37781.1 GNAT family N-acetyltransferase [Campylobacterota bacterium]
MKTILLSRSDYIDSISAISDPKSRRFGEKSLAWWDRHFNWKKDQCLALADKDEQPLTYLFGINDRYLQYLTIHNLFTPLVHRQQGYARELLSQQFAMSRLKNVKRFKLCAVPQALKFYDKLGFIYWGINTAGDYYCDLPLPQSGLDGVSAMVQSSTDKELIGNKIKTIQNRTRQNGERLTEMEKEQFDADKKWLGKKYRHKSIECFS